MKTLFISLLCLITCLSFDGCLKDVTLQKYTYYLPVYSLKTDVREAIKSAAPQNISVPGKIYVQGKYIYVNEIDKGIHIIDYSQPSAPANVAFIPIPGNENITISGNYLYADEYADLLTINITNPLDAKLVNANPNAFPNMYQGDSLHIISGWRRVDTFVKSKAELVRYGYPPVETLEAIPNASQSNSFSSGGSMASFTTLNHHLYTISSYNSLDVFSLEKESTPAFVQTIQVSAGNAQTIYPFENNLFIGSNNGVSIYDASDGDNPVAKGSFAHITACDPVIAENNIAFATIRSGSFCGGDINELDVLNTTDLTYPTLIKSYSFTNPRGLAKEGNNLFVCDGGEGLKILDATDVNSITLTKTISGFEANDVIVNNGIAIVTATNGLYLVDYSNVGNAKIVGKVNISK